MNQLPVSSLQKDMSFEGFLLVRTAEQRTDARGNKYLNMMLCDRSGEINALMWDQNAQPPKAGGVVQVGAYIQEFNGRVQMKVLRLRQNVENEQALVEELMPRAARKPEDMMKDITDTIDQMQWPQLKALMQELIRMTGDKLLYFPAAQRVHHAERGGLLNHTTSMLKSAKALLPVYPFLNGDLLFAGVIAHDLCKTTEMLSDKAGNVADYTARGILLGHLVDGVAQVRKAAAVCGLEDDECTLLLSHMIISHHGVPEYGSPKAPMFPEAEMLHMLDNLDAKMNEMETAVNRTPAGAFSEKVWALDRRIYHPNYPDEQRATTEQDADKNAAFRRMDARKAYDGLL